MTAPELDGRRGGRPSLAPARRAGPHRGGPTQQLIASFTLHNQKADSVIDTTAVWADGTVVLVLIVDYALVIRCILGRGPPTDQHRARAHVDS